MVAARENPSSAETTPHLLEIVTGVTVLLMIVALPALAYRVIDLKAPHGYVLTASFDHVIGIRDGTDVRVGGITVGHVVGLALDPNSYVADATMKIDRGIRLPNDTVASVISRGPLGNYHVSLAPGTSREMIPAGGEVGFTRSPMTLQERIGQRIFDLARRS